MATPCLVLVDGEHYPPVNRAALDILEERGYEVVAALFLGGAEKTADPPDLGVPLLAGDAEDMLGEVISKYQPKVVLDLSDEPVVGYRRRMRLAARALIAGVAYGGADFRFDPPPRPRLTSRPTVAVVGTGKRTGKTAVSIELARHWRKAGRQPCIVTMGRGGPPEPVVLRQGEFDATPAGLGELASRGLHAASDYVEDAVFAGVDTVGTRRCGGGLAGATVIDNFELGVEAAEQLDPDLLIYEGSGSALPPAAADATVLVMRSDLDPEYLRGYFGPYRLGLASVVVVLEAEDQGAHGPADEIAGLMSGLPNLRGRMVPQPLVAPEGRRVALVTTAHPRAGPQLAAALEAEGAEQVTVVHGLGDRRRLREELEAASDADLVLVEVKAAAVDVVLPWAEGRGKQVAFVHNRVVLDEGIERLTGLVEQRW